MFRNETHITLNNELKSAKILIIVKDHKRRYILRKELQIAHYDVIAAENEVEGLYLPEVIKPDLIILDMTSSKRDAFQVLEQLKNELMICPIPVIFLTDKDIAMLQNGVEPVGVYYMQDPYKLEELQACIRKALVSQDEYKKFQKAIQQVKGNLTAMLIQELHFPTSIISGFAELLNRQVSRSKSSVRVDYLQHVIQQADHLKDLIEDFSYLLHAEQTMEEINLIRLVRAAIERFQKQIEEKKQKINLKIHNGNRLVVQGKGHHLFMALRHLILHAHKFTRVGGTIKVEITPMDDRVRIGVTDTGIRIPVSQQGLIRDHSRQGWQALTERYRGKGLGLTIVRLVVEQHHGSIGFENRPGTGSRFWIDLPLSRVGNRYR